MKRDCSCQASRGLNWHVRTLAGMAMPLMMFSCFAAEPTEGGADGKRLTPLESLLAAESQGMLLDRSAELASTNESMTDSIRWQAGFLALKGSWRSAIDLDPDCLDADSIRYYSLRGDAPLDIEGHRKLAKWCKSHGLDSRADAHWFGVLDNDPLDVEARKELGFVLVGNRWFSPQELSTVLARSKSTVAAWKQWMPKVREWVISIEGKDTKKRLKAIQQLKQLKDPDAVAALNVAVGQVSSDAAIHILQAISRFQTREACISLAGIAIAEPSSEVGNAAIDALKLYPLEFFVPDLLDVMCTEYELKSQTVTRSNGDLVLQLMQIRELRNQYQATQIDKLMSVYAAQDRSAEQSMQPEAYFDLRTNSVRLLGSMTTSQPVNNQVATSIAAEESKRIAEQAKADVDKSNEAIRMLQRNVAAVLRRTTGAKLDDQPSSWWEWWDDYQERYPEGEKYIARRYYEDSSSVVYSPEETSVVVTTGRASDCLVLGTPIQTEKGLKAVELIRVGDQIVSQDIATGELSLRPVLRTTARPPAATRSIVLENGESIRATLGHPWWVIGTGWVRTRDLKEGTSLRTTTGFAKIERLEASDEAVTYNLVVDDDHTYFVGRSRALSFDASEIVPTFQRVPGVPAKVLWKE